MDSTSLRAGSRRTLVPAALALLAFASFTGSQAETPGRLLPAGAAGFPASNEYRAEGGPEAPVRITEPCIVTRIVDGDTLDCEPVGRIRLIGIDTPERDQPAFGDQATEALLSLLPPGTEAQSERDVEDRDIYDRALRYLWVDGVLVNWVMVRSGHAVLLTYLPNVQYVDALTTAERRAREASEGLWATGGFGCEPVEFRRGSCP